VIITDRLHAMLLALAMGRTVVVAGDNSYGKLRRYADTWLSDAALPLFWTQSVEEATALATELVSKGRREVDG
jgi:pyruvyl transferase EpsO